ncbi:MAG: aldehyde dehydrogenase EutE [Gemmatales bacterium]|nr:aldehyde dehydrogenase EutE [Gemmatales bacterium]MDW7995057.1 aldehyde dehydrogenase EutE [Gemmatales bacterium]
MSVRITDAIISRVVQEVLAEIRGTRPAPSDGRPVVASPRETRPGRWGVFDRVDDAIAAAEEAQRRFEKLGPAGWAKAVQCIRRICIEQADPLGREEYEETKIGRLDHKIEKLIVAGERTPGVEFLLTHAYSGSHGLALVEYAPFGVIGAITPVTHSLPTIASNAISMLAAGNAVVFNPHPGGAGVARHGIQLFNQAIEQAIGIDNLLTVVAQPTLESAQAIFEHKSINLIVVTGGPAVARAALRSSKRAIVAGPGNPPVVVDETADLANAARSILRGAAYDNNLLCIGEKEVFALDSIFDELCDEMEKAGAVRLDPKQIEALTQVAFTSGDGKSKHVLNKDLVGKDPHVLAEKAGFRLPRKTELLFGETPPDHPFVLEEQMMPFIPFVRCRNFFEAVDYAKQAEHGFQHTAIIHSRNLDAITYMARELNTTLFIANGPCVAGLGIGGEGYLSYSIATPTGEGVTTPLTFTRQRRLTVANGLRII